MFRLKLRLTFGLRTRQVDVKKFGTYVGCDLTESTNNDDRSGALLTSSPRTPTTAAVRSDTVITKMSCHARTNSGWAILTFLFLIADAPVIKLDEPQPVEIGFNKER